MPLSKDSKVKGPAKMQSESFELLKVTDENKKIKSEMKKLKLQTDKCKIPNQYKEKTIAIIKN